jgi:hypothetical protein
VPAIFVIRRSLQQTSAFLARVHRPTLREVGRSLVRHWRIILGGMLLVIMTTVSFYLITVSAVCGLAGIGMLRSRLRGYGASSRSGMSATT